MPEASLTNGSQCDKARPTCSRCSKTGRKCVAYEKARVFIEVVPKGTRGRTLRVKKGVSLGKSGQQSMQPHWKTDILLSRLDLQGVDGLPAYRKQFLATFLDSYLPDELNSANEQQLCFSWMRQLPHCLGRSKLLDMALVVLCMAYFHLNHQAKTFEQDYRQLYGDVLNEVHAVSQSTLDPEELLATCMALVLYEVRLSPKFVILSLIKSRSLVALYAVRRAGESTCEELAFFLSPAALRQPNALSTPACLVEYVQ